MTVAAVVLCVIVNVILMQNINATPINSNAGGNSTHQICSGSTCRGHVSHDHATRGTDGTLTVTVRHARNLDDTDGWFNDPDPYVIVYAVSSGRTVERRTDYIQGTENPTWNSVLNFGCGRWANFLELQVWDADPGSDDAMSARQRTTLLHGNHRSNRHNAYGSGYMIFDYNFVLDGNQCRYNPCRNGGTCVDGCGSYTCRCVYPYTGTNCQHVSRNLRIYARYGHGLPDEDGLWNDSDPYMEVIAYDADGNSVTRRSAYRQGDQSPVWNEWLHFGRGSWRRFSVRVYDSDWNNDDPLSSWRTYTLGTTPTSRTYQRMNCYSGYIIFDYHFN